MAIAEKRHNPIQCSSLAFTMTISEYIFAVLPDTFFELQNTS
jgi:hypothetical protein